ncbi:1-acyl-sn-glycerol-3-phosphate acyltransferase [Micromonospora sp. M42]|uniref:lysophospholipid acyltransferase family protein n=1 Tax=Micromonospora sp. M42 TaxID=457406 RepID=UPI000AC33052|nr:1-acyl-sn-glycerol-3-phosphate acyltransferase [Micromonospora sp. M42]
MNSTLWRAPLLWRGAQTLARAAVGLVGRLEVTGDVPDALRRGPLILAANHISPFDPVVLAAACRVRDVAPRIMATGGLFRTPVIGALMRRAGHIRVDRGTAAVHRSLSRRPGRGRRSVVLVYPEGASGSTRACARAGQDRHGPARVRQRRRRRTGGAVGFARGTAVPRAQGDAAWGGPRARPPARHPGHFGAPVPIDDLRSGSPGAARHATDRIIDAITDDLVPLRPDEPDLPRHVDPGRPVDTARAHRRHRPG